MASGAPARWGPVPMARARLCSASSRSSTSRATTRPCLGVWPRRDGSVEVHLSPGTFWRTVQRAGLPVTSTEHPERLFPHRHAFAIDGIECLTFSGEPVLPPGVLTPGYALRLT